MTQSTSKQNLTDELYSATLNIETTRPVEMTDSNIKRKVVRMQKSNYEIIFIPNPKSEIRIGEVDQNGQVEINIKCIGQVTRYSHEVE